MMKARYVIRIAKFRITIEHSTASIRILRLYLVYDCCHNTDSTAIWLYSVLLQGELFEAGRRALN